MDKQTRHHRHRLSQSNIDHLSTEETSSIMSSKTPTEKTLTSIETKHLIWNR
jgi:hypothetical protein